MATNKEKLEQVQEMLNTAHSLVREVIADIAPPFNDGGDLVNEVAVPLTAARMTLVSFCADMR